MNNTQKKIAITTGDVNGIGAEITIKALNSLDLPSDSVVIISNQDVMDFYGSLDKKYEVINIDYDKSDISPGLVTSKSGEFSYQCLLKACQLAKNSEIGALVTAPVSKLALHQAGHFYNGQTEILQEFLGSSSKLAEMLFVAKDFRVLLLTRHVPIKSISLDLDQVYDKIQNLSNFFKSSLGIMHPKFALCGFNPHAGENGILGAEELETLIPAAQKLRKKGIDITDPLPADTLFIKAAKAFYSSKPLPYDCYIANYHDQGLTPIKTVAADMTVNMTIGLDIIRTSPAHGTAFDIAGKNTALTDSMKAAILEALRFV